MGALGCAEPAPKPDTRIAESASEPHRGGVLTVGRKSDPSGLDPHLGTAGADHVILYTLYDTLIDFDPHTLEPRPGLARRWIWEDERTLVVQTSRINFPYLNLSGAGQSEQVSGTNSSTM